MLVISKKKNVSKSTQKGVAWRNSFKISKGVHLFMGFWIFKGAHFDGFQFGETFKTAETMKQSLARICNVSNYECWGIFIDESMNRSSIRPKLVRKIFEKKNDQLSMWSNSIHYFSLFMLHVFFLVYLYFINGLFRLGQTWTNLVE